MISFRLLPAVCLSGGAETFLGAAGFVSKIN